MDDIHIGQLVRHIRNRKRYLIDGVGLMKFGDGPWVDAVYYVSIEIDDAHKPLFTRDRKAFLERFEDASQASDVPPIVMVPK